MYCWNRRHVCFIAHQNYEGVLNRDCTGSDIVTGSIGEVTITGLKPETNYEVKMSAINGKGESESSPAELFKTEPVRKFPILQSSLLTEELLSPLLSFLKNLFPYLLESEVLVHHWSIKTNQRVVELLSCRTATFKLAQKLFGGCHKASGRLSLSFVKFFTLSGNKTDTRNWLTNLFVLF